MMGYAKILEKIGIHGDRERVWWCSMMEGFLEEWDNRWAGFFRVAGGVKEIDLGQCTAVGIVYPVELSEMLWNIPVYNNSVSGLFGKEGSCRIAKQVLTRTLQFV